MLSICSFHNTLHVITDKPYKTASTTIFNYKQRNKSNKKSSLYDTPLSESSPQTFSSVYTNGENTLLNHLPKLMLIPDV